MNQEGLNPEPSNEAPVPPAELQPVDEATPLRLPAPRNPFFTLGNLVLAGMFAVGLALLYGLRLRACPAGVLVDQSLAHAKVEAALNVLGAAPTASELKQRSNAKAIVNEFYTAARQRQVPRSELRGDPFVFHLPKALLPKPVAVKKLPAKPQVPAEEVQMMKVARSLRLQTVLIGKQKPYALVSNNLVTTGQTIQGWLVVRIAPGQVELRWKNKTHVLTMQKSQ